MSKRPSVVSGQPGGRDRIVLDGIDARHRSVQQTKTKESGEKEGDEVPLDLSYIVLLLIHPDVDRRVDAGSIGPGEAVRPDQRI